MNHVVLSEPPMNYDHGCVEILKTAEPELAAYVNAVKELFGAKEAQLAAERWLQELETTNVLPVALREWRMVTINAARRLATRFSVSRMADKNRVIDKGSLHPIT